MDLNTNYHCGQQIAVSDLKIKRVNDLLLETRQSLHIISKKGLDFHIKALSCAAQKWDIKNEPTESGTSACDAMDFTWRQIHEDMNDIKGDDSAEEQEDSYEAGE